MILHPVHAVSGSIEKLIQKVCSAGEAFAKVQGDLRNAALLALRRNQAANRRFSEGIGEQACRQAWQVLSWHIGHTISCALHIETKHEGQHAIAGWPQTSCPCGIKPHDAIERSSTDMLSSRLRYLYIYGRSATRTLPSGKACTYLLEIYNYSEHV